MWHQILFLEIRTGEAQGPLPSERTDELPIPLNVNDIGPFNVSDSLNCWTDSTFSIIRYECYDIHRAIFRGRVAMDQNEMSIENLLDSIDARKLKVFSKYEAFLDDSVPVQRCARTVMKLLLARCDGMVLTGRWHQFRDPAIQVQMKNRYVMKVYFAELQFSVRSLIWDTGCLMRT